MPCIWSDLHIKTFARHIKQLFVVIYLVDLQWDSAGVAQKIRPPAVQLENVVSRQFARRRTSVTEVAARAPALSHMHAWETSNVARIMQFLFIKSADFGNNSVSAVCKRHCFISVSSGRVCFFCLLRFIWIIEWCTRLGFLEFVLVRGGK